MKTGGERKVLRSRTSSARNQLNTPPLKAEKFIIECEFVLPDGAGRIFGVLTKCGHVRFMEFQEERSRVVMMYQIDPNAWLIMD